MSDKKYFWIKLKTDFFERDEIKLIERMPAGEKYIIFYFKLLLKGANTGGLLMYNSAVPYNEDMLSIVTNTELTVVRAAIKTFIDFGLMQQMEEGQFYIPEAVTMIGSESANREAIKKRRQRAAKALQGNDSEGQSVGQLEGHGEGQAQGHYTGQKGDNLSLEYRDKSLDIRDKSLELEKDLEVKDALREKTPKNNALAAQDARACISTVVETWNQIGLQKVIKMTDKRKKAIEARVKEYGLDTVVQVIQTIPDSDYLSGRVKEWACTFDWLMLPSSFVKVFEGNYVNRDKPKTQKPGTYSVPEGAPETTNPFMAKYMREQARKTGEAQTIEADFVVMEG